MGGGAENLETNFKGNLEEKRAPKRQRSEKGGGDQDRKKDTPAIMDKWRSYSIPQITKKKKAQFAQFKSADPSEPPHFVGV